MSKNEKGLDKLKPINGNKNGEKMKEEEVLSGKESEDLFKLAFRNYLSLVTLADRKAGLLIQVNSIMASVIIAFTVRKSGSVVEIMEGNDSIFFVIPVVMVLVTAALAIFLGILASKPLERKFLSQTLNKEPFFFGSFDRLDPNFIHVTWEKYSNDIDQLFKSDKRIIFQELIKESFQVRKVLSKKFGYLTLAYKIFIGGISAAVLAIVLRIITGI